jgi:two-component system NtrC family response regulator
MASVLIIDDDKLICDWIAGVVIQLGHNVFYAHTLAEGLRKAQAAPFDIVFIDVRLPDGSGLDNIPKIRAARFPPEVIVITGLGDPDEAERAIKSGAWDYLEKPASITAIKLPVIRALEYRAERMSGRPAMVLKREAIIGNSQKLNACLELLAQAASNDASILITGETGTGKELFAMAIHYNSPRAKKNFVVVDCTALPETLVESVLFGHARGAFTGADRSEEGLIKQADGGTLFLDEIGELPSLIQRRFLRVIQEHTFRPVGGPHEVSSDFRLVAATNRNLEAMVVLGQFREDLLYRLRALVIESPPLREIPEDIQELTEYYMSVLCERMRLKPKGLSPEFWNVVTRYPWPGNVRELIRALEKALISAQDEPMLFPKHLPTYIRIQVARDSFLKSPPGRARPETRSGVPEAPPKLHEIRRAAVSEAERRYFQDVLSFAGGDNNKAWRISGLSRSRFYTLLRKYQPDDGYRPV